MKISVSEHIWLDYSRSWFVKIDGVKSGGECSSKKEALHIAKSLAEQLNASFEEEVNTTNELFS